MKKAKLKFEEPKMEVITFDNSDIITTSTPKEPTKPHEMEEIIDQD